MVSKQQDLGVQTRLRTRTSTVFPDGEENSLDGENSADWFFAKIGEDDLNFELNDILTTL